MVTKEKNSNKLSYLESIELTSKRYNNTWDYLHDLISYESLLLEIGNKELNLNCETLSAFKKAVNKIAYELKISTKEQFPDLSKFNDILKDLHHEIQSLKRGQRGEECTTTVLKRLHVPHTVIHNCNLKFLSLQAEYDKIVVTTKGIFVIEVKNNKQDMIITEDGFYQPSTANSSYKIRNIGTSMTQKQSIIQAILDYYRTNLHITSAIPIEKIFVYVNKTSHLFDNYHQLKTLSLDELPGYIDNYASCANFSLAQIQQIKDVIENTCTKQQIMGTIDSKLITKYFLSIIDTLKKKALTKEQLFVQEFMLEYSNLMTEELKTKGLLDELVDSDKSIKKRKLHSELHRERSRELIAHIREITDHIKHNPRYSINHSLETTCVNNTTQDATNHTSRIYKNISKFGSEVFLKLLLSSPSNLLMIASSFLLTSRVSALNTKKFSL